MKKSILVFILLILLSNALLGGSSERNIKIFIPEREIDLNRFLFSYDFSSFNFTKLIFNSLLRLDFETKKFEGELSKKWSIKEDGKVWIFYLRDNVKWHDGYPFTADDVIYTLNLREEQVQNKNGFLESIEKVDDYTVKVTFEDSFYDYSYFLFPILPKHIFEKIENEKTNLNVLSLIGTGPYKLVDFSSETMLLKKNPSYWKSNELNSSPYFEEIEITYSVDKKRECDVILDWEEYTNSNEFITSYIPSFDIYMLSFNQNLRANIPKYKIIWFRDLRFRRAISLLINRDAIVENFSGRVSPIYGIFSPGNLYYTPVKSNNYDPEKAKELLLSLGFKDRDGDGILEDSSRNPLELKIILASDKISNGIFEILKEDFKKAGIELTGIFLDEDSIMARLKFTLNWELVLFKYRDSVDPLHNIDFFLDNGSMHIFNPFQRIPGTPWEKEIDDFIHTAMTLKGPIGKKIIFSKIQKLWLKNYPTVSIVSPLISISYKPAFKDLKFYPYYGIFDVLEDMKITE
ncbi:MAG TPA: ABC transporter substrate-binding protein [Dictyoglomaceae bacterium]|nr:ABC transporter substrate-binding protein [Dictyoglomaceae bacterium]HOL38979.1 ABC transporter substrate-binding protein [Dictyoglomaceae bacterium]HPP15845.1 ABC transporter substrate-binding protein [Dictyoglomaceae bacterium]